MKIRMGVVTGAVIALTVGCGSSGPAAYLASNGSQVLYVQWGQPSNGQAQGTITYDSASGSAPSESLDVQTVPVTVTINGSAVTFRPTGLDALFGGTSVSGSLGSGGLTITTPPDSTTGEISTGTLASSDASAYNTAVAAVRSRISKQNAVAEAQQQQAQQQQQIASDQQTVSNDVSALGNDSGNLSGDTSTLANDVGTVNSDLGTVRQDASQGPNGFGNGYCYQLDGAVDYDVTGTLDYDVTGTFEYDLNSLTNDIATVRSDIGTLTADLTKLSNDGGSPTGNPQAAISSARASIRQAVAAANGDIGTINSDQATAYAVANGIATGNCSGDGPGAPPSPIATLRG